MEGGFPRVKGSTRGNRFPKQVPAPPLESDGESELGVSDLGSETGESGEEYTPGLMTPW